MFNFSQRSNIKAYAKNSKLARALKAYDKANSEAEKLNKRIDTYQPFEGNASFTEAQNNSTTNKIDRREVANDNSNYNNETKWKDLLEFKSPQELIDFITTMDWDKFVKANWDQDTINYCATLNWKDKLNNGSAQDLIEYIQSNPMNAGKIFDAAIQIGRPCEVDQFESTQTPEYMFRDMVALYAKKQKNYKAFLTFVNQTTLYGVIQDVPDLDIKELHKVAQQLCSEDNTYEHRSTEFMIRFEIEKRAKG